MLFPKRTQFRKSFKGRSKACQTDGTFLRFGEFGIKACCSGRIRYQTIEASRRAISRKFRRTGKVWVRVFADIPVTSKPAEVRMGKGKGNPTGWIVRISEGQVLFEMSGVSSALAYQASQLVAKKINLSTQFIEWS